MFFLFDINFAHPTIKKSKHFLVNLKYQLKNQYPLKYATGQKLYKDSVQLSHMSFTTSVA
jgi:hypothetical protein